MNVSRGKPVCRYKGGGSDQALVLFAFECDEVWRQLVGDSSLF